MKKSQKFEPVKILFHFLSMYVAHAKPLSRTQNLTELRGDVLSHNSAKRY